MNVKYYVSEYVNIHHTHALLSSSFPHRSLIDCHEREKTLKSSFLFSGLHVILPKKLFSHTHWFVTQCPSNFENDTYLRLRLTCTQPAAAAPQKGQTNSASPEVQWKTICICIASTSTCAWTWHGLKLIPDKLFYHIHTTESSCIACTVRITGWNAETCGYANTHAMKFSLSQIFFRLCDIPGNANCGFPQTLAHITDNRINNFIFFRVFYTLDKLLLDRLLILSQLRGIWKWFSPLRCEAFKADTLSTSSREREKKITKCCLLATAFVQVS